MRYLRYLKRSHDAIHLTEAWKRRNPPGLISDGNDRVLREVTLVITDVEGSTELWEWDYDMMTLAQEVHDSTMRDTISRFCGYEVTTEGDSFTVAFHDAFDAVAWALEMQHAMLEAAWPDALLGHPKAATVYSSDADSSRPGVLLFRGLRVRVAINTGIPSTVQTHELTSTLLYGGPVMEMAGQLADLPAGGQILLGPQTFTSVSPRLSELGVRMMLAAGARQPARGGGVGAKAMLLEADDLGANGITDRGGHAGSGPLGRVDSGASADYSNGPHSRANDAVSGQGYGSGGGGPARAWRWLGPGGVRREAVDGDGGVGMAASLDVADSGVSRMRSIASGVLLRTPWRSSLPPGISESGLDLESQGGGVAAEGSGSGRGGRRGRGGGRRLGRPGLGGGGGGRGHDAPAAQAGDSNLGTEYVPLVIDLGSHWLDASAPQVLAAPGGGGATAALAGVRLTQIVARQLAPRTAHFPPLKTARQIYPSYFEAPCAASALLPDGLNFIGGSLPAVTMAFAAPDGLRALEASQPRAAKAALDMFCSVLRTTLSACNGYECQEKDGIVMAAFASTASALEWALVLQLALLRVHWPPEVLAAPAGEEVRSGADEVVFRGVRARVGIYRGDITRIIPHRTSGRADYFGTPVNRAARFLSAAAPGQVLVERGTAECVLREWQDEEQDALDLLAQQIATRSDDLLFSQSPVAAHAMRRSSHSSARGFTSYLAGSLNAREGRQHLAHFLDEQDGEQQQQQQQQQRGATLPATQPQQVLLQQHQAGQQREGRSGALQGGPHLQLQPAMPGPPSAGSEADAQRQAALPAVPATLGAVSFPQGLDQPARAANVAPEDGQVGGLASQDEAFSFEMQALSVQRASTATLELMMPATGVGGDVGGEQEGWRVESAFGASAFSIPGLSPPSAGFTPSALSPATGRAWSGGASSCGSGGPAASIGSMVRLPTLSSGSSSMLPPAQGLGLGRLEGAGSLPTLLEGHTQDGGGEGDGAAAAGVAAAAAEEEGVGQAAAGGGARAAERQSPPLLLPPLAELLSLGPLDTPFAQPMVNDAGSKTMSLDVQALQPSASCTAPPASPPRWPLHSHLPALRKSCTLEDRSPSPSPPAPPPSLPPGDDREAFAGFDAASTASDVSSARSDSHPAAARSKASAVACSGLLGAPPPATAAAPLGSPALRSAAKPGPSAGLAAPTASAPISSARQLPQAPAGLPPTLREPPSLPDLGTSLRSASNPSLPASGTLRLRSAAGTVGEAGGGPRQRRFSGMYGLLSSLQQEMLSGTVSGAPLPLMGGETAPHAPPGGGASGGNAAWAQPPPLGAARFGSTSFGAYTGGGSGLLAATLSFNSPPSATGLPRWRPSLDASASLPHPLQPSQSPLPALRTHSSLRRGSPPHAQAQHAQQLQQQQMEGVLTGTLPLELLPNLRLRTGRHQSFVLQALSDTCRQPERLPLAVQVWTMGTWCFKGISGEHDVVQVLPSCLMARLALVEAKKSSKAVCVHPGKAMLGEVFVDLVNVDAILFSVVAPGWADGGGGGAARAGLAASQRGVPSTSSWAPHGGSADAWLDTGGPGDAGEAVAVAFAADADAAAGGAGGVADTGEL